MTGTDTVTYLNPRSGRTFPAATALWRAPDDRGHLNLSPGRGLRRAEIDQGERSLWRYRAAIRLPDREIGSLGEGWTPLVPAEWDGDPVMMKCEHLMPSGSFKDRGTAVMLNYLRQVGVTEILEDSSGNAGASIATYAAALGLRCRIMVPASAPEAKKIQIRAMGATMEAIEGSRQDVAAAALERAETMFYASHNWQSFFLEGTKTLAFEIWEQLGYEVPERIVVPLGYGSNVIGLHIGFAELRQASAIDRLPRIVAVQAANCAAFLAARDSGGRAVATAARTTVADGIACEKPVRLAEVMAAIEETGGAIVAVTETEIVEALRRLCSQGWFVEPTSATVGAALTRLAAEGQRGGAGPTVAVLTGNGLKAVEKIGGLL